MGALVCRPVSVVGVRALVGRLLLVEVGVGDGFVAVGAGSSVADALAVEVAVVAASFVEVAALAGGAFVNDDGSG